MIAALMTAANLGARTTGWGFVVFTAGSIAWIVVGVSSGQHNLVVANGFLTAINLIGIWRWLGRQQTYEDGGKSAASASRRSPAPTLFTATGIAGMTVEATSGRVIGKAVEALVTCHSGEVSYIVVSTTNAAGLDEQLRPVPREDCEFSCDRVVLTLSPAAFHAIAPLGPGAWPASAGPHCGDMT